LDELGSVQRRRTCLRRLGQIDDGHEHELAPARQAHGLPDGREALRGAVDATENPLSDLDPVRHVSSLLYLAR
jgi:hypothetical protein